MSTNLLQKWFVLKKMPLSDINDKNKKKVDVPVEVYKVKIKLVFLLFWVVNRR